MSRRHLAAATALVVAAAVGAGAAQITHWPLTASAASAAPDASELFRPVLHTLPDQDDQEVQVDLGERTADVGVLTSGAQTVEVRAAAAGLTATVPKSRGGAGLVVARSRSGLPLGLAVAVPGSGPVRVDPTSTAFALLLQTPGFATSELQTVAVLRALADGPGLEALAAELAARMVADDRYLQRPTAQEAQLLADLAAAVREGLERLARAAEPPACRGTVVGARTCVAVDGAPEGAVAAPGKGDVAVTVTSTAARWTTAIGSDGEALGVLPPVAPATDVRALDPAQRATTACAGFALLAGTDGACPFTPDQLPPGAGTAVTVPAALAEQPITAGTAAPSGGVDLAAGADVLLALVAPALQLDLDLAGDAAAVALGRGSAGLTALVTMTQEAADPLERLADPATGDADRSSALAEVRAIALSRPDLLSALLEALGTPDVDELLERWSRVAERSASYAGPGAAWVDAAAREVADPAVLTAGLAGLAETLSTPVPADEAPALRGEAAAARIDAGALTYPQACERFEGGSVTLSGGAGQASVEEFDGTSARADAQLVTSVPVTGGSLAATLRCDVRYSFGTQTLWSVHLVGVGEDGVPAVLDAGPPSDTDPEARVVDGSVVVRLTSTIAAQDDTVTLDVVDGTLAWRGQTCADVMKLVDRYRGEVLQALQATGGAGARVVADGSALWLAYASSETGDALELTFPESAAASLPPNDLFTDGYTFLAPVGLQVDGGSISCDEG